MKNLTIAVLGLIAVGGVAFYILHQYCPVPAVVNTTKANSQNFISTSTNSTEARQTVTNSLNGYSVKIPKGWTIEAWEGVYVGIPGEVVFYPDSYNSLSGMGTPSIAITVSDKQSEHYTLDTEEEYKTWLSAPAQFTQDHNSKLGTTTVAGISAVQYTITARENSDGGTAVVTWFRSNGKNYDITFNNPGDLNIYKNILATFVLTK